MWSFKSLLRYYKTFTAWLGGYPPPNKALNVFYMSEKKIESNSQPYNKQCTHLSKNTNWTCGPADQMIDWTTQNLTGPKNVLE